MSLHNVPRETTALISDELKLVILAFYKDFASGAIKLQFEQGAPIIYYKITNTIYAREYDRFPMELRSEWVKKAHKYKLTVDMFDYDRHINEVVHL